MPAEPVLPGKPLPAETVPGDGTLVEVEPGRVLPGADEASDRLPVAVAEEGEFAKLPVEMPDEGELVAELA